MPELPGQAFARVFVALKLRRDAGKEEATQRIESAGPGITIARALVRRNRWAVRTEAVTARINERRILVEHVVDPELQPEHFVQRHIGG